MAIYVFTILLILIVSFILKKSRLKIEQTDKLIANFSFIILFAVSGLRASEIGTDTSNYIVGFQMISRCDYPDFFNAVRWEKGYVLFNKLASLISTNEQFIILATSFVIIFLTIQYLYKYSSNIVISIYLFITLYYYFVSFNAIRQFMAIGIFSLAIKYIYERKIVKYLLIVIVSSLFHQTALLYIPLYFIYGFRLNWKNISIIILSSFIIIWAFDYYFSIILNIFPDYQLYAGTKFFEGSGILTTLISASILLYGIYVKLTTRTDIEFDFLFFIMIITFIISFLSTNISLFNRLVYNYSFFSIIFIPKTLSLIRIKENKVILYLPVLIIPFAYFLIRLIEGWHRVTPYHLFW